MEVEKLGHGGLEYIAQLFGCDPKTIRRGMAELESEEDPEDPEDPPPYVVNARHEMAEAKAGKLPTTGP